jgi:phosphatidylglycerophosphate synthase
MKITMQKITFPTILTIIRLVVGFFIVPVLVVAVCPYNQWYGNILVSLFFLAVSFTDFLDGQLARRLNEKSKIGGFLDALADRFFILLVIEGLILTGNINNLIRFIVILWIVGELVLGILITIKTKKMAFIKLFH